jgi:hypothetical protein
MSDGCRNNSGGVLGRKRFHRGSSRQIDRRRRRTRANRWQSNETMRCCRCRRLWHTTRTGCWRQT